MQLKPNDIDLNIQVKHTKKGYLKPNLKGDGFI